MTRHLLKLIWRRRRANGLLLLEMFLSFVVVFVVATVSVYFVDNYRQPLGFHSADVWDVHVGRNEGSLDTVSEDSKATFSRLLTEVRELPPVVEASALRVVPYSNSAVMTSLDAGSRKLEVEVNAAGDELPRVLGLQLVAGRWFEKGDEALAWEPAVINQALARALYKGRDPLGQRIGKPDPKGERKERRVVGVITDFRKNGELAGPSYSLVGPTWRKGEGEETSDILLKLRPGTDAAFEETLVRRFQALAPGWSFEVKALSDIRDSSFRQRLIPLVIGGLIAFFLLFMVGLGLIGVLWQNLLQRTREIGLRRAAGASRAAVRRQIVGEQLLIATLALGLGLLLVVQLPLLPLVGFLNGRVLAGGALVSMAAIYALVLLCTLYPSGLAGRVAPAEALRYE